MAGATNERSRFVEIYLSQPILAGVDLAYNVEFNFVPFWNRELI